MVAKSKALRTPGNFLLVNMSFSNVMMSTAVPMVTVASFEGCDIHAVIMGGFGLMTINTMAAIAAEKYYAIVRMSQIQTSWKQLVKYLIMVWINSALWVLLPVVGWGRYILEGLGTACCFDFLTQTSNNRAFVMALVAGGAVLPLSVIVSFYIGIYVHVRSHSNKMRKMNVQKHDKKFHLRSEIKIVQMTLILLVIYLIAWTPYVVVALMGIFGYEEKLDRVTSTIPAMVAKASALYNPIVYLCYHRGFQSELRRMGICLCMLRRKLSTQFSGSDQIRCESTSGNIRRTWIVIDRSASGEYAFI
ncbi:rhodopsin, GQ-coupled-like [Lingula anatina]|uniref:Rhodopsin, GQ-coupled-like n=1 Tax=Lingula anatina TaxID=7574 RepID=A0A1S3J6A1_LINAN|nr:rhodopsin, GQ-coupled-like [Lingula anatina]|eukprot:XP_013405920.1 rhodopsin, GQ-coupled-like [Lingula anatina]